jgi:hypothetical protein
MFDSGPLAQSDDYTTTHIFYEDAYYPLDEVPSATTSELGIFEMDVFGDALLRRRPTVYIVRLTTYTTGDNSIAAENIMYGFHRTPRIYAPGPAVSPAECARQ